MVYYLYMILCDDGSIYTGTASDYLRRIGEHVTHAPRCAKYTRSRNVVSVVGLWRCESKSAACKYEYAVKTLARPKKERLIGMPDLLGTVFFVGLTEQAPSPIPLPAITDCISAVQNQQKVSKPS